MNTRIIKAPLGIEFSQINDNESVFKKEFDLLSENNDDPISAWLKAMRAKGKVIDESEPTIQLLVELHRKIDTLSAEIKNEKKDFLKLEYSTRLDSIGHNLIIFEDEILQGGKKYYGRIDIAVFPMRKMPLFFEALDSTNARIYLMHERDIVDFDSYITARERSIIRESKLKV